MPATVTLPTFSLSTILGFATLALGVVEKVAPASPYGLIAAGLLAILMPQTPAVPAPPALPK